MGGYACMSVYKGLSHPDPRFPSSTSTPISSCLSSLSLSLSIYLSISTLGPTWDSSFARSSCWKGFLPKPFPFISIKAFLLLRRARRWILPLIAATSFHPRARKRENAECASACLPLHFWRDKVKNILLLSFEYTLSHSEVWAVFISFSASFVFVRGFFIYPSHFLLYKTIYCQKLPLPKGRPGLLRTTACSMNVNQCRAGRAHHRPTGDISYSCAAFRDWTSSSHSFFFSFHWDTRYSENIRVPFRSTLMLPTMMQLNHVLILVAKLY